MTTPNLIHNIVGASTDATKNWGILLTVKDGMGGRANNSLLYNDQSDVSSKICILF